MAESEGEPGNLYKQSTRGSACGRNHLHGEARKNILVPLLREAYGAASGHLLGLRPAQNQNSVGL